MEETNETKQVSYLKKLKEETEKLALEIVEEGIESSNLDSLGKLVDIHKDITNEEYWCTKEEYYMRYRNYSDSYGDDSYGRSRDSHGRYMDDSYGRRGVKGTGRGRYRGHEYMGEMEDSYGRYMESHNRYGTGKDSVESLEYMLQSAYDFMKHISEEAGSQEEMELVKEYAEKISRI